MTPQQEVLNNELPGTDCFIEVVDEVTNLKDGQNKIIKMIEDNEAETRDEFEKGSIMFKDLYQKVEAVEKKITDGFQGLSLEISRHITESKDNKISELTEQLKNKKTRSEAVKDGVIIALLGGGVVSIVIWFLDIIKALPAT